jgi:hypothetical protein
MVLAAACETDRGTVERYGARPAPDIPSSSLQPGLDTAGKREL